MQDMKRITVKPFSKYKFEVAENYTASIYLNALEKVTVTIPKGYTTDGATVPRIFWSLYPPYKSEYFTACVLHDFLCSRAMHEKSIKKAYKKADKIFYIHLKALNVNKITCFLFYTWVNNFHKLKCYFKGYK